ncbi:SDR family oxidoreductase [Candidatus Gracilibacteria bacterium]|nr:SDR family oxidoreductase [Candidatus Gracilibacteria bacterium]NJM90192.1 SDR family oxidoreductase [Hydrococcus sp. RU_2_2]NJP21454.1 SDR family oxidoreductase [Hydrococcus sp. CRU_1_1]
MTNKTNVLVIGSSRGIGLEIVSYLIEKKSRVKALLRSTESRSQLEAMGIEIAMGDALDSTAVEAAMQGSEPLDAVISTIGGLPKDGQRADYLGNKNLIDAAVKAKVKKFILISSIGSGESVVALPPKALEALKPVLIEKEKAEQYLIASGLTYIIIRPGGLKSEPATGNGILSESYRVSGMIHRADVAQLTCKCLWSEKANCKILSAIDRNMMYGQEEVEELQLD